MWKDWQRLEQKQHPLGLLPQQVGTKGVLSFSVCFSFDQAPLLVKRNAIAQDLVIFIPEIFRVLPRFDLAQRRITRCRQVLRRLGHLRLKGHDTRIFSS